MSPITFQRFGLVMLAGLLHTAPSWAHDGEDHSAPAAVTTHALLPRASATSDDFELVAVLEGSRLLVHLDRAASNEPVAKAKVEVEGAGPAKVAPELAPGVYAFALAAPLAAGPHALTFTVEAADGADLLTATLEVPPDSAPGTAPGRPAAAPANPLPASWPWLLALLAPLAGAGLYWRRVRRGKTAPVESASGAST